MDDVRRRAVQLRGTVLSVQRCVLCAVLFTVPQLPMLRAVRRDDLPADRLPDACLVPVRLSVLLDLCLVVTLLLLAVRVQHVVRVLRPRTPYGRVGAACVGLAVGAAVVGAEDARRLFFAGSPASVAGSCASALADRPAWLGPLAPPEAVLWGLALVPLLVLAVVLHHRTPDLRRTVDEADPRPAAGPLAGTVICCSGGGIRSASFCLGALQELHARGRYLTARRVYGVSGGGYTAAAFHVLRTRSAPEHLPRRPDEGGPPPDGAAPPELFGQDSPELARLRRRTRYLAASPGVVLLALSSWAFGLLVNIALLAVVLRATAWVLGWALHDGAALRGLPDRDARVAWAGDWAWVPGLRWGLAAVVLLVLLEKAAEHLGGPPGRLRRLGRSTSLLVLVVTAVLGALLLAVPHTLVAAHDAAARNAPTAEVAGVLHAVGLISSADCTSVLAQARQEAERTGAERYGACGRTQAVSESESASTFAQDRSGPTAALLGVLTAVLAAVRASRSTPSPGAAGDRGRLAALAGRAWQRVERSLLPWAASGTVAVVCVLLLLVWTLEVATDDEVRSQWEVARYVVGLLLFVQVFTDANSTSLHGFYRERLSQAYLVRRTGPRTADGLPAEQDVTWDETLPSDGGPELVLCAAANVSDPELVPTDRGCTPFVFRHDRIGMPDPTLPAGGGQVATTAFEHAADWRRRSATVAAAMAISGAAVAPMTGRASTRSRPYRLLLTLANARLGVWVPNPYWVDQAGVVRRLVRARSPQAALAAAALPATELRRLTGSLADDDRAWLAAQPGAPADPSPARGDGAVAGPGRLVLLCREQAERIRSAFDEPGQFRLLKEAFGSASVYDRKLYVTDGGHYDNLGLVEALRSRPAEVFVIDASADAPDSFAALGEAIATARMDLHVDVDLDPRQLRASPPDRARVAWGTGTATWPDTGEVATIHLVKAVLTDGLPWDLEAYVSRNRHFPRTSTGDQLYGEWDVEAYRGLGQHLVSRLFDDPGTGLTGRPRRGPVDVLSSAGQRDVAPRPRAGAR